MKLCECEIFFGFSGFYVGYSADIQFSRLLKTLDIEEPRSMLRGIFYAYGKKHDIKVFRPEHRRVPK